MSTITFNLRKVATAVTGLLLVTGLSLSGAQTASALAETTPTTPAVTSTTPVEVGVKFTAASDVTITGIKLYKTAKNTASIGSLWNTETDRRLTTATFSRTATGWIEASFAKPIQMSAGDTYIASYYAPKGSYAQTPNYFNSKIVEGPITYPVNAGTITTKVATIPTVSSANSYGVSVVYEGQTNTPAPVPTNPTVGVPTITAKASTVNTISLAWNSKTIAAGTKYTVSYGTSATTLTTSRTLDASVGNGITLTALKANTNYFIKVAPVGTPANSVTVTMLTKTATTPTPAPPTVKVPVQVAVVGDSNSTGHTGRLAAGIASGDAYIAQNKGYIKFAGGWAVDGSSSTTMANNVTAVPNADVTVIMAGTNDLVQGETYAEVEDNLQSISAKVGAPETLILAIAPFNAMNAQATDMNRELEEIAARNNWEFLDPWASLRNSDNTWVAQYRTDGIHTTKAGYGVVGLAVEKFIAQQYAGVTVK